MMSILKYQSFLTQGKKLYLMIDFRSGSCCTDWNLYREVLLQLNTEPCNSYSYNVDRKSDHWWCNWNLLYIITIGTASDEHLMDDQRWRSIHQLTWWCSPGTQRLTRWLHSHVAGRCWRLEGRICSFFPDLTWGAVEVEIEWTSQ